MLSLTFCYLQKIFLSFADICKYSSRDVTGARCQGSECVPDNDDVRLLRTLPRRKYGEHYNSQHGHIPYSGLTGLATGINKHWYKLFYLVQPGVASTFQRSISLPQLILCLFCVTM